MNESVQDQNEHDRLSSRVEKLESRVEQLGNIATLSKKAIKYLIVGLVVLLVICLGLSGLSLVVRNNAELSCKQAAHNSIVLNKFLRLLIGFSQKATTLTPKEREARVEGYRALIINIPDCLDEKERL